MPIQTTRAFFTVPSTCKQTRLAQPSRNPHLFVPFLLTKHSGRAYGGNDIEPQEESLKKPDTSCGRAG